MIEMEPDGPCRVLIDLEGLCELLHHILNLRSEQAPGTPSFTRLCGLGHANENY